MQDYKQKKQMQGDGGETDCAEETRKKKVDKKLLAIFSAR